MGLLSIQDMHRLIEQDVHSLGVFAYGDRESEEIDLQINRQIYKFIDSIIEIKVNGRKVNELGFQDDQVTLDSLRTIHIIDENVTTTETDDYISGNLPDEYYHYVKSTVVTSYTCKENGQNVTKTKTAQVRIMTSQEFDLYKEDSFHKTNIESPLGRIVGNKIYVYFDSTFSISSLKMDYIKKPDIVKFNKDGNGDYQASGSVHCNLPDNTHYTIVDMTTKKIMKVIEAQQQKIVNFEQE